jgi:valyl-tRNA synthetase
MKNRYTSWVENLNWDWCISRQRYYGVPFPVWYCADCGQPILPDAAHLPVDPLLDAPEAPCPACGSSAYIPEEDVLDTWATSSMTPLIVTGWLSDQELHQKLFPMTLRPQAHEIIRTWTFYTIVKSHYHFDTLPWEEVLISGWGIAGEGMGKISKSKGGGPMPPMAMLEKYSADAVRYWASSTSTGKDAVISEEKISVGQKLVTKLWNLARFSERFLSPPAGEVTWDDLTSADRWILSALQHLIAQVTAAMDQYDYAYAKNEIEKCLWVFADNYLEMAKGRLYADDASLQTAARFTLSYALLTFLKLFAPFMPHVTEAIYLELFSPQEAVESIHTSDWPIREEGFFDQAALDFGQVLIQISSLVRGFKSRRGLSLGTPLEKLSIQVGDEALQPLLLDARPDLKSVTRADIIDLVPSLDPADVVFELPDLPLAIGISPILD